jgi:hypothetical protein
MSLGVWWGNKNKNMKVNRSTKSCQEYNAANTEAIGLGLLEAHEPNEAFLAAEKKAEEYRKREFEIAKTKEEILKKLDPASDGKNCLGVSVEISKNDSGWRMYIGPRWGSHRGTWVHIGDKGQLGIDVKQLEKAKAKLAEQAELKKQREEHDNQRHEVQKRYEAAYKDPELNALMLSISRATWLPTFTGDLSILPDGRISYRGETFTVDQWKQIVALREQHCAAIAALKATFKA